MKEYADKRRNARESLIVVGDQVLLKQSKADVLTPAFDPRPFSVIGVNGSMELRTYNVTVYYTHRCFRQSEHARILLARAKGSTLFSYHCTLMEERPFSPGQLFFM